MGTTQLQLYNLALLHVTDRNLAATSDAVSARYALDDAYAGALDHCLSQGYWNWALRRSELESNFTDQIGFPYRFDKPADWVRTYQVSADASMDVPYFRYADEGTRLRSLVHRWLGRPGLSWRSPWRHTGDVCRHRWWASSKRPLPKAHKAACPQNSSESVAASHVRWRPPK